MASRHRSASLRQGAGLAVRASLTEWSMGMSESYDVPDVQPDPETGLSNWLVLSGTAIVGRIEETLFGYVPVVVDVMGIEIWRGTEMPFRASAIGEIEKHSRH